MWSASRVNWSFSRVRSRNRREKRAEGHSLQHTLLTLATMVLSASLNMLLGALREQQQLRGRCSAGKLVIFEGSELPETRETRISALSPTQPHQIDLHGPVGTSKYETGLGVLCDQQQLRENFFVNMFVHRPGGFKELQPTSSVANTQKREPWELA